MEGEPENSGLVCIDDEETSVAAVSSAILEDLIPVVTKKRKLDEM